MNESPRTRLGTISIWVALIPVLALTAWLVIAPPCKSPLSSLLDIVGYGTAVSLPFSIVAVVKDKPKKRALIGLSLSLLPVICFLVLVAAIVYTVAAGSTGAPGKLEILYSGMTGSSARMEPGVYINTETKYYDISASTEEELRAQMIALGPNGYAAHTSSSFRWRYDFREREGFCSINRIRVDTQITFTYPRWKNVSGDQRLQEAWDRELAGLEKHEKGHEEIARKTSQDIFDYLTSMLPAYQSCDELNKAANALAQAVLDESNKKDREFDRITDHGRVREPLTGTARLPDSSPL